MDFSINSTCESYSAGIQIGATTDPAEERLLSEAITPSSLVRRNHAFEIARLHAVLHYFENKIRTLIQETLKEHEGADWQSKLPQKVLNLAESRQKTDIERLLVGRRKR